MALTSSASSGQTTKLEEFDTVLNAELPAGYRHNAAANSHRVKASALAADTLLGVHDLFAAAPGEVLVGERDGLWPSCRRSQRLWASGQY